MESSYLWININGEIYVHVRFGVMVQTIISQKKMLLFQIFRLTV